MTVILILCMLYGLFLFLSDGYVETNKKLIKSISKKRTVKESLFEKLYKKVYNKIISKINISEEKEKQLDIKLKAIGINETPKEYIAYGYSQSIVYVILGVILSIVSMKPIISIIFFVLAYYNISKREKEISEKYEKLQNEIEKDLPKFCSVITSKLSSTNNVENIIKSFYPIANPVMKEQLNITLADIKTGSIAKALERFENRIRSLHLSDITRGLRAVSNGDNQTIYFAVKQEELNKEYKNILEKEIDNRPSKLRPLQFMIVGLFIFSILYSMLASIGEMMLEIM